MKILELTAAIVLLIGTSLVLSQVGWFGRASLIERLRPYTPLGFTVAPDRGVFSAESLLDALRPIAEMIGGALSRLFGVDEEIDVKLRRLHHPLDAVEFRLRQVGYTVIALLFATVVVVVIAPPAVLAILMMLGVPLLAFLFHEQRVISASESRQHRLFLELSVIVEQVGMLLAAGYSLGGALDRMASRGRGVAAEDLRLVVARTRQGLSELDALREWAELARVDALDRVVAILALNQETTDLPSLLGDEARAIRREAHRDLVEAIEKRDQLVWIPVTVAALVPGSILIGIPFVEAMRAFSNAG